MLPPIIKRGLISTASNKVLTSLPQGEEMDNPTPVRTAINAVRTFLKGPWRVLTNKPTAAEEQLVAEFKESRKPIQCGSFRAEGGRVINDYFMPVEIGNWVYPALDKMARDGITFRLGIIPVSELASSISNGRLNLQKLVDGSTFAWANASYAFFLMVDSEDKVFTLSALGMEALDVKKTPKRLQEVTRIVQIHRTGQMKDLSYMMLTNSDLGIAESEEVIFDGVVFIRKTFAIKACFSMPDGHEKRRYIAMINRGTIGRLIMRLLTDRGLVKGLAVVVEDNQLDADVVFHESALKTDVFSSNGKWQFTAFTHPHTHTAMWDMQTMYHNHTWLLTEERFSQDLTAAYDSVKDSIAKGEIPDWILYQEEDSHSEDGAPSVEQVVAGWKKSHIRWQEAGLDLHAASNIMYMAFGSVLNQMKSALSKKRWWCPMTNAVMATVTTREALERLGGFDFGDMPRDVVFYDDRFGVVLPGDRFAQTADLHDTWDQDGDQAKFIHIKLWSSSPILDLYGKNHRDLRDTNVIAEDLVVPCTPEEAIDVVVVIRSPNGPGGYSIERADFASMKFMNVNEACVPVIDLTTAPPAMATLQRDVEVGKIPTSVQYSGKLLSRENAVRMITAQMSNPGVGAFANAVMAWSAIFGPSYPKQLPAIGNDVIDCLQQSADTRSFGYLTNGFQQLADDFIDKVIAESIPVDEYVLNTRFPISKRDERFGEIISVDGKFTKMNKAYLATYANLQQLVRTATLEMRMKSETRNFVMEAIPTLKPEVAAWARNFSDKYGKALKEADRAYEELSRNTKEFGRFAKVNASLERNLAVQQIAKEAHDEIWAYEKPEKWAVALYRWMVDPDLTRTKYGVLDRVIFQNGSDEQALIMDLLIEGIHHLKQGW
jgi:hypothetical protein